MARDITIKLIDANGEVVESDNLEVSKDDFERRFHEKFYDAIKTYAGRAENIHCLRDYQIVMEVKSK